MNYTLIISSILLLLSSIGFSQDFLITDVYVKKDDALNQLVFTIEVEGLAGNTIPVAVGDLDGAPVFSYVFPTTLNPSDVGFDDTDGIVALGLTSHPDFDDTPLWDENLDSDYANDGELWHSHWVVLIPDETVPGGLSVKPTSESSILPPTNPEMPMYMDSPGYPVVLSENKISCIVPLDRVNNQSDFNYDGVTALMKVNTSNPNIPLLGVYEVYAVASGDLSLPYSIGTQSCDVLTIDISSTNGIGLITPETVSIYPNPASTELHLDMSSGFILEEYDVRIYNLSGTVVYGETISSLNMTISIDSIGSAGMYILKIINSDTEEVRGMKKIILN